MYIKYASSYCRMASVSKEDWDLFEKFKKRQEAAKKAAATRADKKSKKEAQQKKDEELMRKVDSEEEEYEVDLGKDLELSDDSSEKSAESEKSESAVFKRKSTQPKKVVLKRPGPDKGKRFMSPKKRAISPIRDPEENITGPSAAGTSTNQPMHRGGFASIHYPNNFPFDKVSSDPQWSGAFAMHKAANAIHRVATNLERMTAAMEGQRSTPGTGRGQLITPRWQRP